jgi:DNA transformation protein
MIYLVSWAFSPLYGCHYRGAGEDTTTIMAVSKQFKDYICELLSGIGDVSTRAMFGGAGLYCDGVMFALIAGDRLYIKVDEPMKVVLADLGCGPFMVDFGKGKEPKPMNGYWSMPEGALDDAEEACMWGQRALDFAQYMQHQKKKKRKRPSA